MGSPDIDRLEAEIASRRAKIKRIKDLGEDTFPDGAILTFIKHFVAGLATSPEKGYVFTAVKCEEIGKWYLSDGTRKNWATLVEFLTTGVDEVFYATELEQVA